MHERSLVRELLRQVDAIRLQHEAERVSEVRVRVGPLSGVEPLLLASAFEELVADSRAAGASLVIDEVPLLAVCKLCDRQMEVTDFVFRCRNCDGNVHVTQGDEFELISVSLSESVAAEEAVS